MKNPHVVNIPKLCKLSQVTLSHFRPNRRQIISLVALSPPTGERLQLLLKLSVENVDQKESSAIRDEFKSYSPNGMSSPIREVLSGLSAMLFNETMKVPTIHVLQPAAATTQFHSRIYLAALKSCSKTQSFNSFNSFKIWSTNQQELQTLQTVKTLRSEHQAHNTSLHVEENLFTTHLEKEKTGYH